MADREQETAEEQNAGKGKAEHDGSRGISQVLAPLRSKELLLPAALSAVGAVVAAKGPDLLRRVTDTGEQEASELGAKAAGGARRGLASGGLAGKMLSKALPGGGDSGQKKTRRLPIERWTDVAVPVEKAYAAWTDFGSFPKFMHRVVDVEPKGRDRVSWGEKIWFSSRRWEGRITDRRKDDRIAWETTSGMSHRGVVSFHRLGDNLTRVMVTMEFEPNGVFEKMASGLRFVKRAVESDLARFKAYVEMEDAKGIEYRNGAVEDRSRSRARSSRSVDAVEAARRERKSRREERRRETAGAR